MAQRRSTNFDITLRAALSPQGEIGSKTGAQSKYSLTAAYRSRTADTLYTLNPSSRFWQEALLALSNPTVAAGRQMLTETGAALFRSLMVEGVRDLWIRARSDLDGGTVERIRLRLAVQPPVLACLPWELLYDHERNELFAASPRTSLVRVEHAFQHVGTSRPLRTEMPVSLLIAAPDDPSGQIDTDAEVQQLTQMLTKLGSTRVQLNALTGRFNIVELRKRLEQIQPDVLHYIGHGLPDGLLMWHREQPTFVAPGALRTVAQHVPSLKLVFLNACLAGQLSPEQAFSTVGPQLLQAGIPAVIAMQFEIADQVASDLSAYVYEELLTGSSPGTIDTAISHARSNLYALAPDAIGYATPVLWLNAEEGVIFDLPESASSAPTQNSARVVPDTGTENPAPLDNARIHKLPNGTSSPPGQEEITTLRGEATAIQRWLDTLEPIDSEGVNAELRVLLAQRRREIHTLRNLFTQLQHLERVHQQTPGDPQSLAAWRAKLEEIRRKQKSIQQLDAHIEHPGQIP